MTSDTPLAQTAEVLGREAVYAHQLARVLQMRCERLTEQRDTLLEAARLAVERMRAWNEAVERVIGRQPKTGIELAPLIDAIAACDEGKP